MKTVIMTLLVLGFTTYSYAKDSAMGAGSSGGGFAVVCRTEGGNINSAELLDLYEAKHKYKYELIPTTGSLEGDYMASVRNTYRLQGASDVMVGADARNNLDLFLEKVIFLGPGHSLPKLNDLGVHSPAPKGCAIEPLAVWIGKGEDIVVKVKAEIWENLSTLDQAALVQHELFYSEYRNLYERTSENSRAAVATIFSANAEPALDENIDKLRHGYSSEKDNKGQSFITAFRYEILDNVLVMHLSEIMGRSFLTKAVAEISLEGVKLKSSRDHNNDSVVIALTDKVRVSRTKIVTQQAQDWEIEFTFSPNRPVKIAFIQKGVLIQEATLNML